MKVPPGPPFPEPLWNQIVCGVVWCYTGPTERADEVFAPIRAQFGPPALDGVQPLPFPVLQSMFDSLLPPGDQWYWKTDTVKKIPDEAIALHLKYGAELPTMQSTMHLYPIDGAASRVPDDATAWNNRDARWNMVIGAISPDPAHNERMIAWARAYWNALHPYSAGGAYVNMMMDEGQDRVRAAYGDHYDRLAQIKAKYDPGNLFHINQNIKPA
jgi:FAD/FMN-containing dehydrogenase